MAIAANIIVGWPSTILTIPTGWTRETALDSRYILGAATSADADAITNRGFATHTHTSPPHTPTQNSHTHDFEAPYSDASTTILTGTAGASAASEIHVHSAQTSNSATATNQSSTITIDPTSNDLDYLDVIWIKSKGTPTVLPLGCIAFFASDTLPSSWTRTNNNKYLRGAAVDSNGGGTGGANTHTHTSPAHTHTQNSHSHTAKISIGGSDSNINKGTGLDIVSLGAHTHSITLNPLIAVNQSVTTTLSTTANEPPYKKLNTILAGAASLPDQIICLWLGTNANIPSSWSRYTAMDGFWLKGAAANGESTLTTGGTVQHTHTASNCQPIQDAHSHTPTDPGPTGTTTANQTGSSSLFADDHHTHVWDVTSDVATNNTTTVIINDCAVGDAYPPHRTAIYISFSDTPSSAQAVYTSYSTGLFDLGSPQADLLPEISKKIAQGDLRYAPR